jgi:hypothetical protein
LSGHSQIKGDLIWYRLARAGVDADARALFFFLLAPPGDRPYAGLRRFLPTEPLSFMPDWSQDTAMDALNALQEADLIRYDPVACLVFVPLLLESQPCRGASSVIGAAGGIEDYPDSPIMVGALEHLADAAREAARTARERAGELKEGRKQETALRSAEQMEDMARELEERLARISRDAPVAPAAPEAPLPPLEGASTPPRGGVSDGEASPYPPSRGGKRCGDVPEPPVEGGYGDPPGSPKAPSRGGSRARGHAHAPQPQPQPQPSGEDPPNRSPPARGGPPEPVAGIIGRIRGQGGSG